MDNITTHPDATNMVIVHIGNEILLLGFKTIPYIGYKFKFVFYDELPVEVVEFSLTNELIQEHPEVPEIWLEERCGELPRLSKAWASEIPKGIAMPVPGIWRI